MTSESRPRTRRSGRILLPSLLIAALLLPSSAMAGQGAAGTASTAASSAPAAVAPALLMAAGVDVTDPSSLDTLPSTMYSTGDAEEQSAAAPVETDDAGRVEILVTFTDEGVAAEDQDDAATAAASLREQSDADFDRAGSALSALEDAGTIEVLNRFWINSSILVAADADADTLSALAALPGATSVIPNFEVTPLDAEEFTPLAEPSVAESATTSDAVPVTYGLAKISAPQTWVDFGAQGQGVRVAVLDTGVDATHPDLAGRIVGSGLGDSTFPGGWISFDRYGNPVASVPSDPGSHGTHVAGTVLGGDASGTQIGVAPQAQLMAANVLSGNGGGSYAKILAGLEWALQPFDANGRPAGRPADVVNMSLGSSGYDDSFIDIIRNLRQAGVFPAIAIGNAPCGPTGTSSPGDIYDAFGVGMTNAGDEVDPGSCGAVTNWPSSVSAKYDWPPSFVKPDASAPGAAVFSSMPGGRWGESTGTSMATPHVAGAVALIRSAQSGLSVDRIEQALESTAWRPASYAGTGPDTGYGAGRIDVHAAVASVLGASGVNGTVVDAATGAPVSGATVSFGDRGETWTTDTQGKWTARLAAGDYSFAITRFGYQDAVTGTIAVARDAFSSASVSMTPITVGSVRGSVVDVASGSPIAGAQVQVLGQEIVTTSAADGSYRFEGLPAGTYRVRVSADGYRASTAAEVKVIAALSTTVNYWLAPLQRVLVLGDNGGRTAQLLADNDFVAESAATLADDLDVASYDVIVWDTPDAVDAERVQAFIAEAEAAGTGVIWLDQGSSDASGIAQLSAATGNPAVRTALTDREATSTGYRVQKDHEIFHGGAVSADTWSVGDVIVQDGSAGTRKFAAWFEQLTGQSVDVLAETVTQVTVDRNTETTARGTGIAVSQLPGSRNAFLALHASSTAVDARTWSLASTQLFVNALLWAGPEAVQGRDPQIIVPEIPDPEPGEPGGVRPPTPTTPATPGVTPTAASPTRSTRAPAAQVAPKPNTVPEPPVASIDDLNEANAGGITLRVEAGIAYVAIPDAEPGDWFFLHVYPTRTPIDWIRVNDDGELRIDIARLQGGEYAFAFTDVDGELVGWVTVLVAGGATAEEDAPLAVTDDEPVALPVSSASALTLSTAEQLMLLGAGLLILAAAAVVLRGSRRRPQAQAATAGASTTGAAPTESTTNEIPS